MSPPRRLFSLLFVSISLTSFQACDLQAQPEVELRPDDKAWELTDNGEPQAQAPLARIGTNSFRHGVDLITLAFSADGRWLYTETSENSALNVWEVSSGKLVRNLPLDAERATIVAFSADGKAMAFVDRNHSLRVQDVGSAKLMLAVPCEEKGYQLAFSPKGHYLAIADFDGGFHLRQLPSGQLVRGPLDKEVRQKVRALADDWVSVTFTPDEHYLVLSRRTKTALVWDLRRQKLVRPFVDAASDLDKAGILADGREILTVNTKATTRVFREERATGNSRTSAEAEIPEAGAVISRLETGEQVRKFSLEQQVDRFTLTQDGRILAVLGEKTTGVSAGDRRVSLWNTKSGKQIGHINAVQDVRELVFSPDGKTVATMGRRAIRLWKVPTLDAQPGRELIENEPAAAASGPITSVAFGSDGKQLVSAGSDGVIIWELRPRRPVQRLTGQSKHGEMALVVSPDGRTILAADGSSGHCRRWQYRNERWEESTDENLYPAEWIYHCLAYSANGELVAIGQRKTEAYSIEGPFPPTFALYRAGGDPVALAETARKRLEERDIGAVAFSPDSKTLAIASGPRVSQQCKILLLDVSGPCKLLRSFSFSGGVVRSLTFSPDGKLLALGAGNRKLADREEARTRHPEVLIWQADIGRVLRAFARHGGVVQAVAFSPNGRLLVTAGADHMIRWWRVASGQQVAVGKGHVGPVTSLAFSPDGKTLVSGSEDTTILLWDVQRIPGAQ